MEPIAVVALLAVAVALVREFRHVRAERITRDRIGRRLRMLAE